MKILYAIQGTGNGHLSRAREIIPILKRKGTVDILISGTQADVSLPFEVKYTFKGLSFIFGKKGGVDWVKTYSAINSSELRRDIAQLPVEQYDLVINDFEPVSAWACNNKKVPCIALSHQSAVLAQSAPRPLRDDIFGASVLRYYAPSTIQYGFHFGNYQKNIFTPVIRSEVRELQSSNQKHYTVYLPAYDDGRLIKNLSVFKSVQWDIFSKHNSKIIRKDNIVIRPINNDAFLNSLASCAGVLCGAGFETPAEALFLKKKVLVIPMKNQYEQQCNANALELIGVPVVKSLKKKHHRIIKDWIESTYVPQVYYPDQTEKIIDTIISENYLKDRQINKQPKETRYEVLDN